MQSIFSPLPPLWTSEVWQSCDWALHSPAPWRAETQDFILYASFSISAIARGICIAVSAVVFLMCCYASSPCFCTVTKTNFLSCGLKNYKRYFWHLFSQCIYYVLLKQFYLFAHSEMYLQGSDICWRPSPFIQELQGMQGNHLWKSLSRMKPVQDIPCTPSFGINA